MSLNIGDTIGDYQVVGILGAGGMGKVYKVRNVISERVEAMKILLPNLEADPELADRFIREIKVQASLDHPNIAALHTAQRAGGQLLMLMEFVEGETVEAMLRRGPLPLRDGVHYIRQVLLALGYAHSRGIIHRDIKPANMMVTPSGVVKLMDFGIARVAADRRLTQTGRTVGSLYYMSPEQINGAVNLDARSDLYSLGISLYEIATGRRPFQGDSDYSVMAAHLQAMPVPPVEIDPRLPAVLNDIILTAIRKDPAQRFQTAEAFRRALENAFAEEAPAPAQAAPARAPAAPAPAAPAPAYAAPAPPQPVQAQAAPARSGGSRRMLYMLAGSVATIAILVFAAMQIPKWRQAEADVRQPAPEAAGSAQPAAAQPAPPVAVPQTALEGGGAAPAAVTLPAPRAPAAEAPAQRPRPAPAAAIPARRQREVQPAPAAATPVSQPAPAAASVPATPQGSPPPPPVATPAAQPPAAQPPAAPAAELRALRERMMLLGTRLGPLNATIQNMQRQQAAKGLGMRQDVVSSQQRAAFYLDEAESALRAGDPGAKKNLDAAEREIEKLERFLGR